MTDRRNPVAPLCLALLCTLLIGVTTAQQPLAHLAPPDSALVVTMQTGSEVAPELRNDLSQLDWQGARETLERLIAIVDPASMTDLSRFGDPAGLRGALQDLCPALPDTLETLGEGGPPGFEALLTVQPGLFNVPMIGIVRFDDLGAEGTQSLQRTLDECSNQTQSFEELSVAASGRVYEFASGQRELYVGMTDSGLLVIGQDLRGLVIPTLERASDDGGTSLPGNDPFSSFQPLDGYALGIALRTDPVLEAFGDLLLEAGPGEEELAIRVHDAVDTVDSVAWRGSLSSQGVLNEVALAIDPDRPDPELARLLLCEGCGLARPYLAPADSVAFASSPLPVSRLIDYIDGFLTASRAGSRLTDLLQSEFRVTLDPELLDALGAGTYMYVLESIGTDLSTLLYQPGQVLVVPVSSAENVRGGVDSLLESLRSLASESQSEFPIAIRDAEYRGVDYRRVQLSANIDLGIGLVGENLVIAMPSRSIESAVDTYGGAPSLVGSEQYRSVVAAAPRDAHGLSWQDTQATLNGIADLLRLASQPLAFGTHLALSNSEEAMTEDFGMAMPNGSGGWQVLLPDELQTLAPGTTEAALHDEGEAWDEYVDGKLSDVYRLEGISAGDEITVVIESEEFDTMLFLLDGNGMVLDSNDDSPDTTRSELVFAVEQGREYIIQATSFFGDAIGNYVLSVERAEGQGNLAGPSRPEPQSVAEGATTGELSTMDGQLNDKLSDLYRLEGLSIGEHVTVAVESSEFDTMLYLRDASGQALQSNDDAPDTSRSEVQFVVEEGVAYEIQVTSYWGDRTGAYTLTVDSGAAPVAVDPPGFAALLALFELPAELFDALARNTGNTSGYAVSEDGIFYSRGFTELR